MSSVSEPISPDSLRAGFARAVCGYFAWRLMQARASLTLLLQQAEAARHDVIAADLEMQAGSVEEIIIGALTSFTRDMKRGTGDVVRHGLAGSVFQIVYPLLESHAATLKKPTGAKCYSGYRFAGVPFSRVLWAARGAFVHQGEWQRRGASAHPLGLEAQEILRSIGIADPITANAHDIYIAISGGSLDEFVRRVLSAAHEMSEEVIGTTSVPPLWGMLRLVAIVRLLFSGLGLLFALGSKVDGRALLSGKTASVPLRAGGHALVEFDDSVVGSFIGAGPAAAFYIRWAAVKKLRPDAARPFNEFELRLDSWWKQFEALNWTDIESPQYVEDLASVCSRAERLHDLVKSLPAPLELLAAQEGVETDEDARQLVTGLLKDYKRPEPRKEDSPLDLTALLDPTGQIFGGQVSWTPQTSTPEIADSTP